MELIPLPFVSKPGRFDSDSIIPGRVSDDDGFVTENVEYDTPTGPRVHYFSVAGLRQLAGRYPQIGLVPRQLLTDAEQALDEALDALNTVAQERDEAVARLERINGLQRDGFKISRIQGRPAKKVTA